MWKCRICGQEYPDIKDVMKCEQRCLPGYLAKQEERHNKELEEDMNILNGKRNDYIKIREKMFTKYPDDYKKFVDLFRVDDIDGATRIHIGGNTTEDSVKDLFNSIFGLF